jgi:MFS transporter, PAT family, beta-lactamase induction signal transducer AmpG
MLARFVPWGAREPQFTVEEPVVGKPLGREELVMRGLGGAAIGVGAGALVVATMDALKAYKDAPEAGFQIVASLLELVRPAGSTGWFTLVGLLAFGAIVGLMTAAVIAARHGAAERLQLHEAQLEARERG